MIEVTDREKAIAAITTAVAFVIGVWVGIWLVPAEALSVPTNTYYQSGEVVTNAVIAPVPRHLPIVSVLAIGAAVYYSWTVLRPDESTEQPPAETATDGGQDERR